MRTPICNFKTAEDIKISGKSILKPVERAREINYEKLSHHEKQKDF